MSYKASKNPPFFTNPLQELLRARKNRSLGLQPFTPILKPFWNLRKPFSVDFVKNLLERIQLSSKLVELGMGVCNFMEQLSINFQKIRLSLQFWKIVRLKNIFNNRRE